ncbi:MAG: acyltransferase, partial [Aquimonas sp.]
MSRADQAEWQRRPEGGGRFAIWLIRSIARYGGRWLSRPLLIPITLYFLIVRGPERRASRAYLARVLGRPATLWDCARHVHAFASTILDRVFMLSGQFRSFDLEITGLKELHDQIDLGRGVLLFGSHHGSFEALRVLSR